MLIDEDDDFPTTVRFDELGKTALDYQISKLSFSFKNDHLFVTTLLDRRCEFCVSLYWRACIQGITKPQPDAANLEIIFLLAQPMQASLRIVCCF